jgi:Zn-dependent protease
MLRSWRVGRFFGIDVFFHWSFWALPVIHILLTGSYSLKAAAFAVAFTLVMATCIVMHEFGHVLTARGFGIATRDIILTPLGGLARLERMTENPFEEILIALAGPAVNVVIVVLMFPLLIWLGIPVGVQKGGITDFLQFIWAVWFSNLLLVGFNMIPAFPLDGGRVFRAFLAFFTDRLTATKLAVYIGMGIAALMVIGGLAQPQFIMVVPIAGFIVMAGQLELMMLKRSEEIRRRAKAEVDGLPLDDEVPSVLPAPPEPNFSGYTWDRQLSAWVEWRDGWPVRKYRMRTW